MKRGLILNNIGTPKSPSKEDVKTYLDEFLMDPGVISLPFPLRWLLVKVLITPRRSESSGHKYAQIWTERGSPLLFHTEDLASALQRELGSGWNVQIGMRYGSPSISEALARLRADGVEEIVYAPLFPQFAEATTGSANEELRVQLRKMNWSPEVRFLPPFHAHDGFLRDQAALIRPYLKEADHVVFSFHGLPESHVRKVEGCLAEGCCERKNACELNCYKAQSLRTARDLANRLELPADRWSLGFQSRLGRAKWIGPSTDDVLKNLAAKGVERLVVACPSFVTDCLETLEEIGLGANQDFIRAGGKDFRLAPCLNADPAWTKSLAALVGAIR